MNATATGELSRTAVDNTVFRSLLNAGVFVLSSFLLGKMCILELLFSVLKTSTCTYVCVCVIP
jgi:hypothetical protein